MAQILYSSSTTKFSNVQLHVLNVILVVWSELYFHLKYCCAFKFKVYIKPDRIWDTLLTSKMGVFATIGFCKVIFCRFILYTQCLFCVSLLLVLFRSRWFHLQASEMILFGTIATANVAFYWAMLLQAQLLPTSFLFFVSLSCWVYLVSGDFTFFQMVPTHFSLFLVLSCTLQDTCTTFLLFL